MPRKRIPKPTRVSVPAEERFFGFVQPMMDDRGCWEWLGHTSRIGYARFGALTRIEKRNGMKRSAVAARFSWEIHRGLIPEGLEVCHKCDNRTCVNPAHLFLGTRTDNMRDCINKGRFRPGRPMGEQHGNAKLTESDVVEICRLYDNSPVYHGHGKSIKALVKRFGVNRHTITSIAKGRVWKHLTSTEPIVAPQKEN